MNFAPHPLTLRQLQYVVAIADQLSFRKAAETCHVSQPSLSSQVLQLEEALGVQLFERDKRRVRLTPIGGELVEQARRLLFAADELVATARRASDPFVGQLRLGVIPTVAPYLLPELAPALHERYPQLVVVWTEDKTGLLLERLGRGELDGAILALDDEVARLPHVELGRDPFLFAAAPGHRLAKATAPLSLATLEGEQVLLLDDGHCFRTQALALCTRAGLKEGRYRATSLATLVQMASSGVGVTLLPSLAVAVENRQHTLTLRRLAPTASAANVPSRTLALVWRRGSAIEPTLVPVGETLRAAYGTLVARQAPSRAERHRSPASRAPRRAKR